MTVSSFHGNCKTVALTTSSGRSVYWSILSLILDTELFFVAICFFHMFCKHMMPKSHVTLEMEVQNRATLMGWNQLQLKFTFLRDLSLEWETLSCAFLCIRQGSNLCFAWVELILSEGEARTPGNQLCVWGGGWVGVVLQTWEKKNLFFLLSLAQSTHYAWRDAKQMGPVDVNGSVHTARKQYQRICVRICACTSCVDWAFLAWVADHAFCIQCEKLHWRPNPKQKTPQPWRIMVAFTDSTLTVEQLILEGNY